MAGGNGLPGSSPGHAPVGRWAPALGPDVELLGQYSGSGYREAPYLLGRGGRTLEVSPLLYMLCASLDGRRDLDEVAAVMGSLAGRDVSPGDVAYLLEHKLRPLGVLGGPTAPTPPPTALAVRRAVVPAGAVRRCTGPLRVLFHPFVLATVLVAFVALDAWLVMHAGIGQGMSDLLVNPGLVLLLAAITLAGGAFHELGHATACRYGGAEPGVIGAGIYLIWPVFYNDLNDSYRLGRAGRLRADLGGVYFNAVFSLVLGAGYLATGFEPLVVAVAVQHLAILQQFLPFLRLDGYYLVSDLAGVPDLFRRIRPVLSSLVPGRPAPPAVRQLKPRARAVVTVWVLVTAPLLAALVLLLVVRLPQLAGTVWSSVGIRAESLLAAWRAGDVAAAGLDSLQVVFLLIPPAGIVLTVAHVVRSRLVPSGRR